MYLPSSYSRIKYLLRTRSVTTDLLMSLESQPVRCAIMLCHLGKTRNGYVATYFNLLSSTAASRAAGGYLIVAEHFGENEELAGSNEERNKKKPSFSPKVDLFDSVVFSNM